MTQGASRKLIASDQGHAEILRAIERKKIESRENQRTQLESWTQEGDTASLQAAELLRGRGEFQPSLNNEDYPEGLTPTTWKSFCQHNPVLARAFKIFCEVLDLDWQEIVDSRVIVDWSQSIEREINEFYGRTEELAKLQRQIVNEQPLYRYRNGLCKLVVLFGMGGIGKTTLAAKLAEGVQNQFEFVIVRSLRNTRWIESLLDDLIGSISKQQISVLPETVDEKITKLIEYLRDYRCLVILDNFEDILQGEDSEPSLCRTGYSNYDKLLDHIGRENHKSCLLLTSRVEPAVVKALRESDQKVYSLEIRGLAPDAGSGLFHSHNLDASESDLQEITSHYGGNPFALKIVAAGITTVGVPIARFLTLLRNGYFPFSEIQDLLQRQFERCLQQETGFQQQEVMYWLAIAREPVAFDTLQDDLLSIQSKQLLRETLDALREQSLIEITSLGIMQLPVVMEYVTKRLIDEVSLAILTGNISILKKYALLKAQAKDYIRNTQSLFILQPLIERLIEHYDTSEKVQERFNQILLTLRGRLTQETGYAPGNVLNLLIHMQVDLNRSDFSNLRLQQAYLGSQNLCYVNFSGSDFSKSVFTQTFGSALSIAFSPDGQYLAMGDSNGDIYLWNVADFQEEIICRGHTNWVMSLSFSSDSKMLVSGSEDKTVRLWDIETGECIQSCGRDDQRHTDWVMSVAFHADKQLIASGSIDGTIRLWNASTGQCIGTLVDQQNPRRIWAIALSPHSPMLASSSKDDSLIRLWNLETQDLQILGSTNGHLAWITSVAFSPTDDQLLASSSIDGSIRLWDINTGECLKILRGHQNWVAAIAFSKDGSTLVSSSEDYTIKVWDLQTDRINPCRKTLRGHNSRIWSIAISSDGQTIASGSNDRVVKLWNIDTGRCLRTLQGYPRWITSIAFSPGGESLFSGNEDKTIKQWDVENGGCLRSFVGHASRVWSLAISPDGRTIASGSDDQTIKFWDLATGRCYSTEKAHRSLVLSVAFSPNGEILASTGEDGAIVLWNVATRQSFKVLRGHTSIVRSVRFSPINNQILVTGSEDRTVRCWDLQTNTSTVIHEFAGRVFSVAFCFLGQKLAIAGESSTTSAAGMVVIQDFRTDPDLELQEESNELEGHPRRVRSVRFHPRDSQVLATGSEDGIVRLWNRSTGQCRILEGHQDSVRSVLFNPTGDVLASCSQDGTIKLWNVQESTHLQTLQSPAPYQNTNFTGVMGLTSAQKLALMHLGAIGVE
ncbi:NB-ARC domain-containing protein [Trichocoleus desertorum AS-A10]|uniref:NB-ARC domain-containing protein n=1 Tax=Trichocoleus desertorum TaxID=1481672 RepID=UPI0032992A77